MKSNCEATAITLQLVNALLSDKIACPLWIKGAKDG